MSLPIRKVVLYIEDPDTGKLTPVALVANASGYAIIPVSLDKDNVGVATESTLSDIDSHQSSIDTNVQGIEAKVQNFSFDTAGRVAIQNPPLLDKSITDVDNDIVGAVNDNKSQVELLNKNLFRAYDQTIDYGYIPSGYEVPFRNLTISGVMKVEGTLQVAGSLEVDGTLIVDNAVQVGW